MLAIKELQEECLFLIEILANKKIAKKTHFAHHEPWNETHLGISIGYLFLLLIRDKCNQSCTLDADNLDAKTAKCVMSRG